MLLYLVNLLDNSTNVNRHTIKGVLEKHIPKSIPTKGKIIFDMRFKFNRLIEILGYDCKHDEFMKALKHNPKCLDLSTADDEVILDEVLKLAKIFWQESLSASSE